MYQKKYRHAKSNYRPLSILPLLSNPTERSFYEKIDSHTKDIPSKYQRGFRKIFSSKRPLLAIFEKWNEVLDNSGKYSALLLDLSKAFGCFVHDLLLAKLSA